MYFKPKPAYVKNALERSWDNLHVDILALAYIVFFDFFRNINLFREVIEHNRVFSFRFVFLEYIFDPFRCWNEESSAALIVQKYMQYISQASRILTFDEIPIWALAHDKYSKIK